jgi:hypothetical protein
MNPAKAELSSIVDVEETSGLVEIPRSGVVVPFGLIGGLF